MKLRFEVNGTPHTVDVDPDMPLLWVLREQLKLTGAKFGCGAGICGACTVHLDGNAVPSCVVPARDLEGRKIKTIEGLSTDRSHALQRAWIEEQVPQCGYCQPGMIMATEALIERTPQPSDSDIDDALTNNLCRCGTYPRIRRAIRRVVASK